MHAHASLRPLRRPVGTFLVGLTLVMATSGCVKGVRSEEPPGSAPRAAAAANERIVGIVKTSGQQLEFDDPGANVRNDTLFGYAQKKMTIVPMSDVERVVIERRETNTLATVGLVVGVAFGALLVASAIAVATKESCPFVYSWNGESYVFDAEPYGGAIAPGLERDDYAPLEHLVAEEGEYRFRMTNEVYETQHTNFVELWVVDHAEGARIAADAEGRLYALGSPEPPISARDASGRDLLPWLAATDRAVWEPMAVPDAAGRLEQEIVLVFPRPEDAREARLVVNVATGLWGSHMIRELVQLRGAAGGAEWLAGLAGDPAEVDRLERWNTQEQLYVLRIEVEEPTGWETRALLRGEGPFIAHDRVVALDVSRAVGDVLRVRIRPPRGFWALNSFGIEFGPAADPPTVTRVEPSLARAEDGTDVLPLLAHVDDLYYDMPVTGDWGELAFPAPAPAARTERTVLLHSRGYYDLRLDPAAEPDTALARRIEEEPGTAVRYAAELYRHWTLAELSRRVEAGAGH